MSERKAAQVLAVHASDVHGFSKFAEPAVRLLEGLGVEGDAHAGRTVQHRSRVARNAAAPNLRQVHLMHAELFDELVDAGFAVFPGDLGENITTRGIDLLGLPTGTRLRLGAEAVVELTGLRNPCIQIDRFQKGLMAATLPRDADGALVRKAGVMAVVVTGGEVCAGDGIDIELPAGEPRRLEPV
ncbi:MAG: MOSC domain-containing protein [Comamonadaceae bacterium]|nr:MAG: MOSC domain-containing protein [Comamonadaceae bacterium]